MASQLADAGGVSAAPLTPRVTPSIAMHASSAAHGRGEGGGAGGGAGVAARPCASSSPSTEAARLFLEAVGGAEPPPGSLDYASFDEHALAGLSLVSADARAGVVVCRLPLHDAKLNRYRTLHGGCAATLVDVVGTAAIMLRSGEGGVSLSLSADYLAPAPGGTGGGAAPTPHVDVKATVLKVGRTVAVADVRVTRADGVLAVVGRHVKHVAPRARL